MSQGGIINVAGGGGGGTPIFTIAGDTGSITGNNVTIYAHNSTLNAGSSVLFTNSGTISTLNVTDVNGNTIVGRLAGNATISGTGNTGYGFGSSQRLTSGNNNTLVGIASGNFLTSGSRNCCMGSFAGSSMNAGTESSNIIIGSPGFSGDNNTIRIGTPGSGLGTQNLCYIAGITGATPVGVNIPQVVLCDSSSNLTAITSDTAGYVLTSNGPTATPTFQAAGGGGGVTTIAGDTGSITGANVTIFADTVSNRSGATVLFNNSGTTSTLELSDGVANLSLGQGAGPDGSNATNCTAIGVAALNSINNSIFNSALGYGAMSLFQGNNIATGYNSAIGAGSLSQLITGVMNCAVGNDAGSNYTGSESSNICIANSGVVGESHVVRVGAQGSGNFQQNVNFTAGITGVTAVGSPVAVKSDGQLSDLGFGSATQVLTSNGAGVSPSWQAAGGGGSSPAFSVALTAATSALTSGALSQVTYDTAVVDTNSGFSAGVYTVPTTGNWNLSVLCNFITSVSFTACDIFVNKNSGTYLLHLQLSAPTDSITTNNGSGSGIFPLVAGDTLQISVFATTTGATTFTGQAISNGFYNIFTGYKLP